MFFLTERFGRVSQGCLEKPGRFFVGKAFQGPQGFSTGTFLQAGWRGGARPNIGRRLEPHRIQSMMPAITRRVFFF